jgi:RNA polymerase-binding transcription factor DksA
MKVAMSPENRNRYQKMLSEMHERVGGEVNYVVKSIHEDVDIKANVSSAPVHLADVATETVDVDVQVLHTERSILDQINAALQRMADGSYGRCTNCGATIPDERLNALPYTPVCARCAQAEVGE